MKLFRGRDALWVESDGKLHRLDETSFDALVVQPGLHGYLREQIARIRPLETGSGDTWLAPIGSQPVWAAGVTYFRSREARMSESQDAGGGSFYDRVYAAERPELFFKALPAKVVGPGQPVRIRRDATWSVPEPELTLLINPRGEIVGSTVGNDMSSRDIEGQNPLYLPQAKVYDGSCALGPAILIHEEPLPSSTRIEMQIRRAGAVAFAGGVALSAMKRDPKELAAYLFREQSFPTGCFLLTGTGIVPPDSFTLRRDDEIEITIAGIGTLVNPVA